MAARAVQRFKGFLTQRCGMTGISDVPPSLPGLLLLPQFVSPERGAFVQVSLALGREGHFSIDLDTEVS